MLLAAAAMLAADGRARGHAQRHADQLEIVDLAPSASATLRNDGDRPLECSDRVFRSSQVNGQDKLEPTEDVIASPPIASVPSRGEFHVRVIHATRPLAWRGELSAGGG